MVVGREGRTSSKPHWRKVGASLSLVLFWRMDEEEIRGWW